MTPSWQDRLRAGGHRVTPQRTAILAAIETLSHPTAESIYEHVHGDEPTLNRSTVYRTLQVLQDLGLITHAHLGSGAPVYHLADDPPHVHLVCLSCQRVVSLPVTEARSFAATVERRTGFGIDATHSAIYGTCAQCRARSRPKAAEPGD